MSTTTIFGGAPIRVTRVERPGRNTPQLVEENMRKEVTILMPKILDYCVGLAFGVIRRPLTIERFYNDAGVKKAERAGFA